MPDAMKIVLQAGAIAMLFLAPTGSTRPATAQAALKGAGTCLDEYKANKDAIKAAKQLKKDFILSCRALPPGTPTPIGAATPAPGAPPARNSDVGAYKTAGQCDDEYKAAKPALKAAKETKKVFVAKCRSLPPGTPTPIEGAAAAPSAPTQAPAPTPTAPPPAPRQAPAPAPAPRTQAPAPRQSGGGESACANGYAHLPASHTAIQFCTDAEAQARCPGAPVVWVNTKSKIYHYAGANTYGHTKEGAYMCESDAKAEGDRLSRNGH